MIAIFPEIAAAAAAGDVDRLAILVRRYFCDRETFAPKPDVGRLLINAGMAVKHLSMDTLGALVAKDERGTFHVTAVVNERIVDEPQRRFLLAHMLGHFLLEIQPVIARGDWQVSGYRELNCPAKRYAQGGVGGTNEIDARREAMADEFAAALLLPRGMLRRAIEKIQDPEKTAAFFGVGTAVLSRRLADIGLAPNLPSNFLDAERQIGVEVGPPAEPKPVIAPAEPAMPRSYAASTYGKTEKQTREPQAPAKAPASRKAAAEKAPEAPAPAKRPPANAGKGMERLREIARKMDKPK